MVARSLIYLLVLSTVYTAQATDAPKAIKATEKGLEYQHSALGDRVPDFSFCGYASGEAAPPHVPAALTISPSGGDDLLQIQSAIDQLAKSKAKDSGWRGAIALTPGLFKVSGSLHLHGESIVLRGAGRDLTTIVATGHSRRPLVVVGGSYVPAIPDDAQQSSQIVSYVPVGAMSNLPCRVPSFRLKPRTVLTLSYRCATGSCLSATVWPPVNAYRLAGGVAAYYQKEYPSLALV